MTHRRDLLTWPSLACWLGLGLTSLVPVSVQGQTQPGRATLQPQPGTPAQTQPPSQNPAQSQVAAQPELPPNVQAHIDQLLNAWEIRSSQIEKMHGRFTRYTYDSTFMVEKRCQGQIWYEAPDKGRLDFEPLAVPQDPRNLEKLGPDGTPYTITAEERQRWICDGRQVFAINDSDRTYAEMAIPPQFQGTNIVNSPLPFLFGMQAARAKERYYITLGNMHNPSGQIPEAPPILHLIVRPRWEQDAREWTQAEILLDPTRFLPTAVRILDPGGNNEAVYVFSEMNERIPRSGLFNFNGNPFNDRPPQNYQCIARQTAGSPEQPSPLLPAPQRTVESPRQEIIPR